MGCRTNLPTAWVWMGLRAMGAGCASSVTGGAGESKHIGFFAFQYIRWSQKGLCFPGEPEPHTWMDNTPTTTATWAVPGEVEQ